MHPQLTSITAEEHTADLRAAAQRSTLTAEDPLVLADGRRLTIRPIQRQDRHRLKRLFIRPTPESRYRRYLSPKPKLSERDLDHPSDIDHVRQEALAAIDETDGSFVAAARYVHCPISQTSPLEVADDLHAQGIGTETGDPL
ncbi:MAG: hypothetical protein ACJ780_20285 [Solirubrobacteraceae bacterium]